ncbi:MAG: PCRF domain-containing protein, partial [Candidatus Kapaibacteriota bacterium]
MKEKLENLIERYEFVQNELNNPDILKDVKKFKEYSREFKYLTPIVNKAKEYIKVTDEIESNYEL